MFINILEGLHRERKKLLCDQRQGKLGERYKITKALVSDAYSDITWKVVVEN